MSEIILNSVQDGDYIMKCTSKIDTQKIDRKKLNQGAQYNVITLAGVLFLRLSPPAIIRLPDSLDI